MKSKLCSLTGIAALIIMLVAPVCVADKSSTRLLKQQERYTFKDPNHTSPGRHSRLRSHRGIVGGCGLFLCHGFAE